MNSPARAVLWETWRVTRLEAAWKLALPTGAAMLLLALSSFLHALSPDQREIVKDANAAIALVLIVIPHLFGWLSMGRLVNGRPGFPLYLHYTRPVPTAVVVAIPMAYLTALSAAIYLVSALLLRATSGYAFPRLPVAAWIAAITAVGIAGSWSTRKRTIQVVTMVYAAAVAQFISVERLTAVEIPDNYDWPPRLWPTLFDWPLTDYAWIALIGLASFGITVAMVTRQRRGDDVPAATPPAVSGTAASGSWDWLVGQFGFRCPTSSAARAQLWLDLKSNGFPVVTIGVSLAIMILLMSAVAAPIDASINANPSVSCPIQECFYLRSAPPILTPLSVLAILLLGGNAFGIRRNQGRTNLSVFEATQAHATGQLAALKVLVKSVCVLAAIIAIGISAWISVPLLGDAVFIQMWSVPLSSQLSTVNGAVAALPVYEQLSLVVVAVLGVVAWVAALAVLGALWTRYARRMVVAGSLLLLYGLALGALALARERGVGPEVPVVDILRATSWVARSAMVLATGYLLWRGLAEPFLTRPQATGAVVLSAIFGMAWLGMPGTAARALWPTLLPLTLSVLAAWSFSRVRHT